MRHQSRLSLPQVSTDPHRPQRFCNPHMEIKDEWRAFNAEDPHTLPEGTSRIEVIFTNGS
jgi:hypothetical protein